MVAGKIARRAVSGRSGLPVARQQEVSLFDAAYDAWPLEVVFTVAVAIAVLLFVLVLVVVVVLLLPPPEMVASVAKSSFFIFYAPIIIPMTNH